MEILNRQEMIKTGVVILNWNGLKYLKMFLPGVVRHTAGSGTQIYVADNGSTDGSQEWISSEFSNVNLIRLEKNHGFAEGYNLALAQIDAQYYVLLNSDIEVSPRWLDPLVEFMDSNPDTASCQPKILSYHNRDYFEYAGAAGGFLDKYGYPLCRGRILFEVEKDKGQYDFRTDIFWSTGACMIVRSSAWKECGGFDPDFFAHMEEIDLCWRFHLAGYRVSFVPDSALYHVGGGALPYESPFKTYLNFRNSLFLLYKNLPDKEFRRTLFKRKILDAVAAVFFLLKGQFRSSLAVVRAHVHYYRNIEKLRQKRKLLKSFGEKEAHKLLLNKCLVFEFYILNKRTFDILTS